MKTKLLFAALLVYSSSLWAQTKVDASSENKKFYFPAASFNNTKDFEKNLNNLVLKMAPMEIDEKSQKFSQDAESIYLIQKNYKGLESYSHNENFPKTSLPLKVYAEAMIADPTQGSQFKKTFTDNFTKDFSKLDESTKTAVANGYFDQKMLIEYTKMAKDYNEQLSKSKSDSISYKDAKKLLSFQGLDLVTNTILPLGKNVVKGYVLEYFQPFITGNMWMSIVKPTDVNDLPDISKEYKLVFELTDFSSKNDKETAFKNENIQLVEAGRILNLHIASGIPPEKLKMVFVIHGSATDILLKDDLYKAKYKIENPNLKLIKQMQSKGAKFVVCGQIMSWDGLKLTDLTENVKEAFSAKTALSNYQTQGYILFKFEENS